MDDDPLRYWATAGRFTTLDGDDLPKGDIRSVVDAVQGLLVYDLVAEPFYGVELTTAQTDTIHERHSERLLDVARSVDPRPVTESRPASARVGARCHAFSRMTVAFLRAAGVPARARCGFGAYFRPGWFEDHWVAEYWDADASAWTMVDAQLDETWIRQIGFASDPLAITPEQFVTAGHAWKAWRRGELDAGRCGLSATDEHGAHWIAGNLRLDLASLNKVEMLPWDVWGTGWEPGEQPTEAQLDLFDTVADLTTEPDSRFGDLRHRYLTDAALTMPGTVLNVLRGRLERV